MGTTTAPVRTKAASWSAALGAGAFALSFVPVLNNASFMLGMLGLVCGFIGLYVRAWSLATIGLVLSALGVTITLLLQAHWGAELDKIQREVEQIDTSFNTGAEDTGGTSDVQREVAELTGEIVRQLNKLEDEFDAGIAPTEGLDMTLLQRLDEIDAAYDTEDIQQQIDAVLAQIQRLDAKVNGTEG